jgi:uncharacterized membrane protein YkvA (DUF1232 family)
VAFVVFATLKQKIKELKKQTLTVYFASRDPNLPRHIKIIAILIVAYALSPIDLIPDFIPILGLLDDIVIVPIGLAIIIHLTPQSILEAAKLKASQSVEKPKSYFAAFIFIFIWLATLVLSAQWFYSAFIK